MSYPPGPPAPEPPLPPVVPPTPPQRNAAALGAIVGVLIFALVLGGFFAVRALSDDGDGGSGGAGAVSTPSPDADLPSTDASLARFYGQKIDWRKCGRTDCGKLEVPLDYATPDGKSIELAVLRVPAGNRNARVGSLVVNPGGPGGSGVNFAAAGSLQFGEVLSDRFDIVGFDPRGVGQSAPLKCLDTAGLDKVVSFDPDPDTPAEGEELDALIQGFGQSCLDNSGDLARHMSTEEVARDMDVLRAALGESKLDYLGASYGTYIGATYADLFPDHVGRFVLDGAIDPALSNEELARQQAGGFETALRAYAADCVDQGDCPLGSSVDAAVRKVGEFLQARDSDPLPTSDSDRPLTEGLATLGVWMPLYVKPYWPQLTRALSQAMDDGRGTALLGLADLYLSRGTDSYQDNSMNALYAVNCLDHSDSITTDEVPSRFAAFQKTSPTFGRAFAFSLSTCTNWPVRSDKVSKAMAAKGAPPIVVIGTTRDPATPYQWARSLASELESGRLITRDGDGHTGFQQGNNCVDSAVQKFLVSGTVPADNLKC